MSLTKSCAQHRAFLITAFFAELMQKHASVLDAYKRGIGEQYPSFAQKAVVLYNDYMVMPASIFRREFMCNRLPVVNLRALHLRVSVCTHRDSFVENVKEYVRQVHELEQEHFEVLRAVTNCVDVSNSFEEFTQKVPVMFSDKSFEDSVRRAFTEYVESREGGVCPSAASAQHFDRLNEVLTERLLL